MYGVSLHCLVFDSTDAEVSMKPFFTDADCDMKERLNSYETIEGISLDKVNAKFDEWLSKGKVVYGMYDGGDFEFRNFQCKNSDTHQALLINIQPIEPPDNAESLLKELIESREANLGFHFIESTFFDRAKRLLERGEK